MKKLLNIFLLFIWSIIANAQLVNQQWVVRFEPDTSHSSLITDICIDKYNNIVVAGLTGNNNITDGLVFKINSLGNVDWFNTYSQYTADDYFSAVEIDDSANIYLCGTKDVGSLDQKAMIIKYNSSGTLQFADTASSHVGYDNISTSVGAVISLMIDSGITLKKHNSTSVLWTTTSGSGNNYVTNIFIVGADSSGNIFVSGTIIINNDARYFVEKFDSGGNFLWHSEYNPTSQLDLLQDMKIDKYGNAYLTGSANNNGQGGFAIVKFYPTGNTAWSRIYNPNVVSASRTAIETDSNGNIYVAGRFTTYITSFSTDCHIVKYDSTGNFQWATVLDSLYVGNTDIVISSQNNVYVAYPKRSPNYNVSLSRLSPIDGSLIWETIYNGINNMVDTPIKIIVDSLECIYLACNEGKPGGQYATVVKYCQTVGINENGNSSNMLSIYPNPATTQVTLQPQQPFKNAAITIYNTLGAMVMQHQNINPDSYRENKLTIATNELPAGIYFITVLDEDKTYTCKLIIE